MPKLKRGSKAYTKKLMDELREKVLAARKNLLSAERQGNVEAISLARKEATEVGKLLELLEKD